jgi:hypothetical protein
MIPTCELEFPEISCGLGMKLLGDSAVVEIEASVPRLRVLMLRYLARTPGNCYWQEWRDPAQRPDH